LLIISCVAIFPFLDLPVRYLRPSSAILFRI